jgi:hypothetical protein
VKRFILYSLADGRILQIVAGPTEDILAMVGEGQALLETTIESAAGRYIVDGALADIPPQPDPKWKWDWNDHVWHDPRSLEQLKAQQWEKVKAGRDQAEHAGFQWDGSTFDSDPMSQSRIQGAVLIALLTQQAGQEWSIEWTLKDNSTRVLSAAEMISVGLALAAHVGVKHAQGRAYRVQITQAQQAQAVKQISWDS